jgi:short-subunit dehydrogenase
VTSENERAVLVTGASSGIGAATARRLAADGWRVGLVARRRDRLAEVLDDCLTGSPGSRLWVDDLSDVEVAARIAEEAWEAFGGLDALVNNAGVPMRRLVTMLSMEDVERVMRVNFLSPVRMTLAVLGRMVERGSGVVVNVSSLAGRIGVTTEAAYSASKFALAGWSEAIAADLAGTGVRVRLVLPGTIDTEIWDRPGNDPPLYRGPLTPAEDMAEAIVAAIDSDRFEHYLPDMKAVVEMKTSDPDGFMAGMIETTRAWREQA